MTDPYDQAAGRWRALALLAITLQRLSGTLQMVGKHFWLRCFR